MKWAYGIRRKISAALLLAAIFVLLFVKNMVDNSRVNRLGSSFSSVYEDRLVVESYIYRMAEHLFRKKIMIDSSSTSSAVSAVAPSIERYNQTIREIIAAYERTKLTEDEDRYFDSFRERVVALIGLENEYLAALRAGRDASNIKDQINNQFNEALLFLDHLSRIQISEGKVLNDDSQKIVAGSSLLAKFEVGIIVAIGLMILVLVFESTTVFTRTPQDPRMN